MDVKANQEAKGPSMGKTVERGVAAVKQLCELESGQVEPLCSAGSSSPGSPEEEEGETVRRITRGERQFLIPFHLLIRNRVSIVNTVTLRCGRYYHVRRGVDIIKI